MSTQTHPTSPEDIIKKKFSTVLPSSAFPPPQKKEGKGIRPPKKATRSPRPGPPSLKLRLIWHKFPPQKGAKKGLFRKTIIWRHFFPHVVAKLAHVFVLLAQSCQEFGEQQLPRAHNKRAKFKKGSIFCGKTQWGATQTINARFKLFNYSLLVLVSL